MLTKTIRGLLISTFLVAASPLLAENVITPNSSGQDANSTTNGSASTGSDQNPAAAAANGVSIANTDSNRHKNFSTKSADGVDIIVATIGKTNSGEAWVDGKGMTIYTYEKDANGQSMCDGNCATSWVPLAAPAGVAASGEWTIVTRSDGSRMWAFQGHPLYTYSGDKAAGDVNGNGMNGFHQAM